jgi:hypothetical protein
LQEFFLFLKKEKRKNRKLLHSVPSVRKIFATALKLPAWFQDKLQYRNSLP